MVDIETDPYYVRELLAIISGYLFVNFFSSQFTYDGTYLGHFLSSISATLSVIPLIYASIATGIFASSIERGSLGYLMTMPIRRSAIPAAYVTEASIGITAILMVPIVFLSYISFDFIEPITILLVMFLLFSVLYFYTSAGFLVASITKNSVFAPMFVFVTFFVLESYSQRLVPHSYAGEFIVGGFSIFSYHFSITLPIMEGAMTMIISAVLMLILINLILKHTGLRSGR